MKRCSRLGSIDISAIEDVFNRVNLRDFFNLQEEVEYEFANVVVEYIASSWRRGLRSEFPDRNFCVLTRTEDEGSYGPSVTFYELR